MTITRGQSNLTKRPHRRRAWTVQSCLPGGANVHPMLPMLDPPESTPQTAFRSLQPLLLRSRQTVPIFYWTPYNTWFLQSTRAHNPNGISIGSAVFAEITIVTDRQTDRPRYSFCNNRPHLRSTAIWCLKQNCGLWFYLKSD